MLGSYRDFGSATVDMDTAMRVLTLGLCLRKTLDCESNSDARIHFRVRWDPSFDVLLEYIWIRKVVKISYKQVKDRIESSNQNRR